MRILSTKRAKSRAAGRPHKALRQDALVAPKHSELEEIRFRTIADSMPESICFVDAQQCYQYCNKTYKRTFGIPPEKLKGRPVRDVLGEAIYPVVRPYIEKVLSGEATSYEGYILHKKLGRRYEHIDYLPQEDKNGKVEGFYAIVRDLTELKAAEERFRTFVETSPQAIIIHDGQGKIVLVNLKAEGTFGYSRQELIGRPFAMLMPPRLWQQYVGIWRAYARRPNGRPLGARLELYGMRKDGSEFPAEISIRSIETTEGILISSTIADISDRKRLEEKNRLASILQERARVARDLHDTLAQGFTGIIMNLESAKEGCMTRPQAAKVRLNRAEQVARENLAIIRHSLMELSGPSTRRVADLTGALREVAKRADSMGRARVKFTLRGRPGPMNDMVADNLLFIAQQATDNALRHAHANVIHLKLSCDRHETQLRVQDDGRGFVIKKVRHGMGLTNMRDRAEFIGGIFALQSRPGKGTSIEVRVPFSRR